MCWGSRRGCCRLDPPAPWAGCLCRNFILQFPRDATSADRTLLINAVLLNEYLHFEANGCDLGECISNGLNSLGN